MCSVSRSLGWTAPTVAAISARTLAFRGRRFVPSQAFLERFFFEVNAGAAWHDG
jgi:hypothetical protein